MAFKVFKQMVLNTDGNPRRDTFNLLPDLQR